MTEPLALVVYEKLLPGSQLVNLMPDLKYSTHTLSDPAKLGAAAIEFKPMLVFMDLDDTSGKDPCGAAKQLKQNPATSHIPVVGFIMESRPEIEEKARAAGV